MKLFTPFAIPQKDNCDLCRDKSNKRREVVNLRLDQLFKFLFQSTKKRLFRNDREEAFFLDFKISFKQFLE